MSVAERSHRSTSRVREESSRDNREASTRTEAEIPKNKMRVIVKATGGGGGYTESMIGGAACVGGGGGVAVLMRCLMFYGYRMNGVVAGTRC
jgi:hypothetical protein